MTKFIVSYYKKEDPSEQSIWSSDVSRLTYIIKEFLDSKKSVWNHDYKGIKVKFSIINPILQHIKTKIEEYWINNIKKITKAKVNELEKYNMIYITLVKIKKDIKNDVLSYEILKFIAPYFSMDKKNIIDDITVDLFIDDD